MIKKPLLTCFLFFISQYLLFSQFVSISPSNATPDDEITITFDASIGNKELVGASKVYMHHGVITDNINGTSWKYVKGNWGKDDGIGQMTKVAGTEKWQIKLSPSLRTYFNVPSNENIFRIACVFRNADGSKKGTLNPGSYPWGTVAANLDVYINLNIGDYIFFEKPNTSESFITLGNKLDIKIIASNTANSIKLTIDESGTITDNTVTNTNSLTYAFTPTKSGILKLKAEAIINNKSYKQEAVHNIVLTNSPPIAPLPVGLKPGINYDIDSTKVSLVLEAPKKQFVYAVGDFNNWTVSNNYLMNKTPDGELFWITLNNIIPNKEYAFQYWVDGKIKIADPYADKIADPWNDQYIEPKVYPNLLKYDKTNFGIASIFETNQKSYKWADTEKNFKKPNVNHLVIYELLIRDFLADHDMKTLIDTLDYLKRLGINAIEFMPLNEFEGNDSWGYNPSFHFAVDKYYGSKNDLKKLIETCHQKGIAVILDIVMNHAYGQNPLVQLYFENGKPSIDNPWFNREYIGPYQWGFDFNHESPYTKKYLDRLNKYWLEEFHFDGFRFDFTKGFTNYAPNNSIDGYDQSRINILKRMADEIRKTDKDAYIILEHWSGAQEEKVLSDYGMKLWRNKSYDYVPAAIGNNTGTFADMNATTHVTFFCSHDEKRIADHMVTEGKSNGTYDVKVLEVMYERAKMIAAFTYLFPGMKMIWQFDELGYDIDINFNGRVGRKPLPWGNNSLNYYENSLRQNIYRTYQAILGLRNLITPEVLATAQTSHQLTGQSRRLIFNTNDIDIVLVGNFGLTKTSISPNLPASGKWFDYFSGEEKIFTSTTLPISLEAGEWHLYTNKKLSDGLPGVVEIYSNPVTITPSIFTKDDEITIRFDAKKASKFNTNGLVGADKVYIHSGIIKSPTGNVWSNIVGTLKDDGIGLMNKISDDIWEIKITPSKYFGLNNNEEVFKIGMYFRDAENKNIGKGFRNTDIYFNIESNEPFVTISPDKFDRDTEITITFNASKGNRELYGIDKIYMHSGVGIVNTQNPASSAWNKVVGNWGKDDGIGLMNRINNSNLYQIKLIPSNYYGLKSGEFPYWIAAVFRNADGSKKGTGTPGQIQNGFIADNLDFFLKNLGTTSIKELEEKQISIFPNPNDGKVNFTPFEGEINFNIYSIDGKNIFSTTTREKQIEIPNLVNGSYIFSIKNNDKTSSGLLLYFR